MGENRRLAQQPKWLEGFAQSRFKLVKKHQDKVLAHPAFVALDDSLNYQQAEPEFEREILVHAARWMRGVSTGKKTAAPAWISTICWPA